MKSEFLELFRQRSARLVELEKEARRSPRADGPAACLSTAAAPARAIQPQTGPREHAPLRTGVFHSPRHR